jgi:3-hydroxyisobutyrate dehydrogenase-like beta-hydroxyacid dehydrogenase
MQIGIIGIGLMGHSIAANLQRAGHDIGFLDHPQNQPADDLLQSGAKAHTTIASLTQASQTIILCVTGTPEVEQCVTGPGGILETPASDLLVIDCSTSLPDSTRKLAARAAEHGISYIDAAMTGTTKSASSATLGFLVGASEKDFARARPILEPSAKSVLHVGDVGSGHALKLLHNCVSLGWAAIVADVSVTARHAGIAPEILAQVLDAGAGHGTILDRLKPYMCDGDTGQFEFTISNSTKDLSYFQQMVRDQGRDSELVGTLLNMYQAANQDDYGPRFAPELAEHISKN